MSTWCWELKSFDLALNHTVRHITNIKMSWKCCQRDMWFALAKMSRLTRECLAPAAIEMDEHENGPSKSHVKEDKFDCKHHKDGDPQTRKWWKTRKNMMISLSHMFLYWVLFISLWCKEKVMLGYKHRQYHRLYLNNYQQRWQLCLSLHQLLQRNFWKEGVSISDQLRVHIDSIIDKTDETCNII